MNATTTYEQATFHHSAEIQPREAGRRGIGDRILDWLGGIAERSGGAHRAEIFRRLNAMSDEELAALGMHRGELLFRCFGGRVLI